MAAITFTLWQFFYSFEKLRSVLIAPIVFNGSSAPVLQKWLPSGVAGGPAYAAAPTTSASGGPAGTRGIALITRNGVGDYTITLQGLYQRPIGARVTWQDTQTQQNANVTAFGAPACTMTTEWTGTNTYAAGGGTMRLLFWAPTPGAPAVNPMILTDPTTAGGPALIEFMFDNSTV